MTTHDASRRRFIKTFAAGAVGSQLVMWLPGCTDGEGSDRSSSPFLHGVASGDPLQDRVILWTRLTPEATSAQDEHPVEWEVATDVDFSDIVASGVFTTSQQRDYTVKVDAAGLDPGTRYAYRFRYGESVSVTGLTKTLPAGSVSEARLAVFSCSNYPAGYFHVYAEAAAREDIDAAVHLGDYIYEYGQGEYATEDAEAIERVPSPRTELYTLEDYRCRYGQYRSDPDLQALHRKVPFICVWDDHEIANDTYKDGALNHDPITEGDFFARRDAAVQAYYEWMPIREQDPYQPERIYRSFDFGDLLSLHMLDTRVIGRDKPLDYADYIDPATGAFDAVSFEAAMADPNRQLLGAEQTQWLQAQMSSSAGFWQVLGQQVLMGRMSIPAPIATQQIPIGEYSAIVAKYEIDPASLSAEEQAVLAQPSIPYNLDAWDGYYVARETLLGTALAADRNLVVLSGDTHNAWANDLRDRNGVQVGVEFATSSVSSPGFEEYLPDEDPDLFAAGLQQLVEPLAFADTQHRGYTLVSFTPTEAVAQWIFVDSIKQAKYSVLTERSHTLKVLPGAGNRRLVAV